MDPRGDHRVVDYTDLDIFLVSDWMRKLSERSPQEFSVAFGVPGISAFWSSQNLEHPRYSFLRDKKRALPNCIPLVLHGDGVSFQDHDNLMVISFCGLLRQGCTLDNCFLLSAFPKSCSTKATHECIWKWLVWDLQAVRRNKYPNVDPFGNEFPSDSLAARLAGTKIMPDNLWAYTFGVMGDNDFFQVELGLPHQGNMPPKPACHRCQGCKIIGNRNWFNFSEGSPWRRDIPRSPPSEHCINSIDGFSGWSYLLDWLHTVDLGIAPHAIGNVMYDVVYNKLGHESKSKACALLLGKMHEVPSTHGKRLERLSENDFTTHRRHLKQYPCLTHVKGAEVRNSIPGMLHVARHYNDGSDWSMHQVEMMQGLNDMYKVIHDASIVLTADEFSQLKKSTHLFLKHYTWLANKAAADERCMWSVVPKFHYLVHLIEDAAIVNPRFTWCYGGEDMVGRIARLCHMCLFGTPVQKLTLTSSQRYRVAMHVRFTRM